MVMRLVWASDIHLDMAAHAATADFVRSIVAESPTSILITGDIADGKTVARNVSELADLLDIPVYFVLGNHDHYGRSITAVRQEIREHAATEPLMVWLSEAAPVMLNPTTALIGVDGWADGTAGDGIIASPVRLRDETAIEDLAACSTRSDLATLVKHLSDEDTDNLRTRLIGLDETITHVIVGTHVPPFETACRYLGEPTETDHLPHFSNPSLGRVLIDHVEANPDRTVTVLCGHTHDEAFDQPHPQISVHVAGATYQRPEIAATVRVSNSGVAVERS